MKRIVAAVVVVALAALFIRLGFWQLDRLKERQAHNAVAAKNLAQGPVDVEDLIADTTGLESIEFRTAYAEGEFDHTEEVLIRSQVHNGQAGFHVLTPLVRPDGSAILVNRGWVPSKGSVSAEGFHLRPPSRLVGWVSLSQEKPAFGPADPSNGPIDVFNRVDIGRIQQQVSYLLDPIYLVMTEPQLEGPPIPVRPPDTTNEGPHLAYAIQWFGFAVIGIVGFSLLVRRSFREETRPETSQDSVRL